MPRCTVGTENGSAIEIHDDFRDDLPTLVVQGAADRILPIANTADRLPDLIADIRLVRVENGPHNIGWTHPEEVNRALLEFLGAPHGTSRTEETASIAVGT